MMNSKLVGMGVALITPFNEDETIDFDALAKVVEHQIKNGGRSGDEADHQ